MADSTLPAAQVLDLDSLIARAEHGIASRVLARRSGGSVTLFAFDAGQGLTEHTSPFDALVIVLEGRFSLTVGGTLLDARAGQIVRLPASVSHAVEAREASRMLLVMLRDAGAVVSA
jgi:quercetin dioxygenase-like cupin family protein